MSNGRFSDQALDECAATPPASLKHELRRRSERDESRAHKACGSLCACKALEALVEEYFGDGRAALLYGKEWQPQPQPCCDGGGMDRFSIRRIREILRLKHNGRSQRKIASSVAVAVGTINGHLQRAKQAGRDPSAKAG